MGWNYRVFRCGDKGKQWFEIRETIYSKKGKVRSWDAEAETFACGDLKWTLKAMARAIKRPVLDAKTGKKVGNYKKAKKQIDKNNEEYFDRLITDYVAIGTKDENGYDIVIPDFPGCIGHGDKKLQAIGDATKALNTMAAAMRERGQAIPKPSSRKKALKKFMQRNSEKDVEVIRVRLRNEAA